MVLWSLSVLPFSQYMPSSSILISSTLFVYCFETNVKSIADFFIGLFPFCLVHLHLLGVDGDGSCVFY